MTPAGDVVDWRLQEECWWFPPASFSPESKFVIALRSTSCPFSTSSPAPYFFIFFSFPSPPLPSPPPPLLSPLLSSPSSPLHSSPLLLSPLLSSPPLSSPLLSSVSSPLPCSPLPSSPLLYPTTNIFLLQPQSHPQSPGSLSRKTNRVPPQQLLMITFPKPQPPHPQSPNPQSLFPIKPITTLWVKKRKC